MKNRLFALGCLTEKNSDDVKSVLNLEISQLAKTLAIDEILERKKV